jgi:hypothetical protein
MKEKIPVSFGRCVLAGLMAGIVGALLANLALVILVRQMGQSFDQLNWFSVGRASMISCLLGAFVYGALARWTRRPVLWFTLAGLMVATLDSVLVYLYSPEAGIARIANPLHYVVAITALVLIPALAPAFRQPTPSRGTPPPLPTPG